MNMFGLLLLLIAQVQSAVGVGVCAPKHCPILQNLQVHPVHQQVPDLTSEALLQHQRILCHEKQILRMHLLHVLVVVGYDGSEQDVQHAQACHYDHHQVEDVKCCQCEVMVASYLFVKIQDIRVTFYAPKEHDEAG